MTLDFINVGYGDAILIRSGSFTMLVDCGDWTVGDGGPDSQRISAADFLRQEGIDTLDLLVLTHLHRDHSGGLAKLLEALRSGASGATIFRTESSGGNVYRYRKNFPPEPDACWNL